MKQKQNEMRRTKAGVEDSNSFEYFLEGWLQELEANLHDLAGEPRDTTHDPDHRALVAVAMDCHRVNFSARSELAHRDASRALASPWLSPTSRTFLWMGGWRSTAVFRLVPAVEEVRARAVEEMRAWTMAVVVKREMDWVQGGVVGMVKSGRGIAAEDAVLRGMVVGAERVAVAADGLRMEVLGRVVEMLSPVEAMDFLAAVGMLQIGLHRA